ncbi:MFS transporter [Coraliomargarita sp. SDUM461004]|uniref:MFS transporter n=1 Tax=Thalassobacterium sedimentorum TaxID=3041258 RepID=A0ABU1AL16_9BACT|nr:MFS transporter [Coraliomargarita sp. SDUM461004]MDQ8195504.1 MFS transporter [Coraliomargarita sp. SDUM461004]
MSQHTASTRSPWSWVPTGYFAEGLPYVMITWVAATMFKYLGHDNTDITLWVGNITLVWSLKPLWAAFLEMFKTKKWIVMTMEFSLVGLLAALAFCLQLPSYFTVSIGILWLMAFASATHDICMDGTYLTSLDKTSQAKFVGIQGMFWNVGRFFSSTVILLVAAYFGQAEPSSWTIAWMVAAAVMAALAGYHMFFLPEGDEAQRPESFQQVYSTFLDAWVDFFRKPQIWGMLTFVFLFRSGEGLLLGVGHLFLQAPLAEGGVGLTLAEKSIIDGGLSIIMALAGGLLGGLFISRYGLKKTLFTMAICLNVPNVTYVYLAYVAAPDVSISLVTVTSMVVIEKFFYSFGFVANMLYMMQQISPGKYHMTHYAFCTALMNLVLWPTIAVSGYLSDTYGYLTFFVIVMFATIPSFFAAWYAPFPRSEQED